MATASLLQQLLDGGGSIRVDGGSPLDLSALRANETARAALKRVIRRRAGTLLGTLLFLCCSVPTVVVSSHVSRCVPHHALPLGMLRSRDVVNIGCCGCCRRADLGGPCV